MHAKIMVMTVLRKIAKLVCVAAAACLALAAVLALLETAAVLAVGTPVHAPGSSWRFNHVHLPNSTIVEDEFAKSNPDFLKPYPCEFNAQGWREAHEVSLRKSKGTFRIFYVGDSFVEGTCPQDQTLSSLVEKRMRDTAAGKDLRIEVINTGVRSYSPILYYLVVRYKLCAYRPDLVVVSVDMTDDADDWNYGCRALLDNCGDPWAVPANRDVGLWPAPLKGQCPVKATSLLKAECYLDEFSSLYNVVRNAIRTGIGPLHAGSHGEPLNDGAVVSQTGMQRIVYKRWQWCHEPWDSVTLAQVTTTLGYIRRICALCRSRHIKLMLTSVPHYEQYSGDTSGNGKAIFSARPHSEIAALARRMGVPYHNAFEDLKPLITGTPQTQYYYAGDMHFNPRGYRIWADAQYKFLTDSSNHLLPVSFY